jgi:hypothetical protein
VSAAPSAYDTQAAEFLARFGFTLSIELRTPETCPPWGNDGDKRGGLSGCKRCGTIHGREYLVTLTGAPKDAENAARWRFRPSLAFPYWGAHADRPDLDTYGWTKKGRGKHPSAYDVLACLASDSSGPETPDEVVEEFGDMKPSRAIAIAEHGRKVRAFFTEAELEALQVIQ